MSQLRQHEAEFKDLGVDVAVVTFQSSAIVDNYVRETKLGFPMLIDDSLTLYAAYGMEHGKGWDLWGPSVVWMYLKLMAKGRMLHKPVGDVTQLGGDVLIDPEGIVRLHYVGIGPADRPSVESMLAIVRE